MAEYAAAALVQRSGLQIGHLLARCCQAPLLGMAKHAAAALVQRSRLQQVLLPVV